MQEASTLTENPINSWMRNKAFRRFHMMRLLCRVGMLLPSLLVGLELRQACRSIEQVCWREVRHATQPVFEGDLPSFLMTGVNGQSLTLSVPMEPIELGIRMAEAVLAPLPEMSSIGVSFDKLAQALSLTQFESQWLLWSYCIRRFGQAILPTVPMHCEAYGCEVLALLGEMPVASVQDAVASRRLYALGFLDGVGADDDMPSLLSGWLSVSDDFADRIEQPYTSDSDLVTTLCQAQVSLMASR